MTSKRHSFEPNQRQGNIYVAQSGTRLKPTNAKETSMLHKAALIWTQPAPRKHLCCTKRHMLEMCKWWNYYWKPKGGHSLLIHMVARYNNIEIVKLLVMHPHHDCNRGLTPSNSLLQAAQVNHFYIIKYLVDNGCTIRVARSDGKNAIHTAFYKRWVGIFLYLWNEGLVLGSTDIIKSHQDMMF